MRIVITSFAALFVATSALAQGLSINVPVVGRLTGAGGVLYATAVDITNNANRRVSVDFYFDGRDNTGRTVSIAGSIGDFGLVSRGAGSMAPMTNSHFSDFVNDLVTANMLPSSMRDAGILGSLLLVFNGSSKPGEGSATARFYNAFGGGEVGVSLRGREITSNEPRKLVITARDTTAVASGAQTYPNLFVNHTGLTPGGTFAGDPATVQVSAVSARTGSPVGTPLTITIDSGQTTSIPRIFQALGVTPAATETALIVRIEVISGSTSIHALVSQVDTVTRDGAIFEAVRGDF